MDIPFEVKFIYKLKSYNLQCIQNGPEWEKNQNVDLIWNENGYWLSNIQFPSLIMIFSLPFHCGTVLQLRNLQLGRLNVLCQVFIHSFEKWILMKVEYFLYCNGCLNKFFIKLYPYIHIINVEIGGNDIRKLKRQHLCEEMGSTGYFSTR